MCGIFAYMNYRVPKMRKEIFETLIKGLQRLEYRGYDSAGVAIDGNNHEVKERHIHLVKKRGKVKALDEELYKQDSMDLKVEFETHFGIAHTRWATHGVPNAVNSHPQRSDKGNEFVVIHNGIITNYKDLRKFLEGAFALVFKSIHYPGEAVATRNQVLLCVAHLALRGPPLLHYSAGGSACPAAHDKMTSQSCQRDQESAHINYRGLCHSAICSHSSLLHGCSLEPPNKYGGQSKAVQSSTVGSSWLADCQAGLLRMLLLLLWYMPMAGGLEVKTTKMTQMVFLHDNVTVPCKIPGSPHLNITTMGIIWYLKKEWNESEVSIYEFYGNRLKAFRPGANVSLLGLERGDASLYLPRIELNEAGEYRCKLVVTPEQAEGTTRLDVVAYPAMKVFVEPATERNGKEQHIICNLDRFYPEAFDIKWEICTLNDPHLRVITEGVITGPAVRNDDGTFSVISSLALKPALEDHGNVYYCVVSHRSLLVSKRLNVTLPEKGSVKIHVTIVGPCVLVAAVIVYGLWRYLI